MLYTMYLNAAAHIHVVVSSVSLAAIFYASHRQIRLAFTPPLLLLYPIKSANVWLRLGF